MAVTYDTIGAGKNGAAIISATTMSWTHSATSGAYVIVDVVSDRTGFTGVTYGGAAMTQAGITASMSWVYSGTTYNGYLTRYVLTGAPSGSQTVLVTFSASTGWAVGNSLSYLGVGGASTSVLSVVTGTNSAFSTGSLSIPTNGLAVASIGALGAASNPTSFGSLSGGTNRYNYGANFAAALEVSDSGSSPTTFNATPSTTTTNSSARSGIYTILSPANTYAPASATIAITGGTPDVGVTNTVLYGSGASGYGLATTGSSGTTVQWNHTFGAFDDCLIVAVQGDFTQPGSPSYASYTRSLSMNGYPLTLLGAGDFIPAGSGGYDGWLELWALPGAAGKAGTTQQLTLNEYFTSAPSTKYPELQVYSLGYSGVGSIGTASVSSGNNAAPTCTSITSTTSDMVVGVMGSNVFTAGTGSVHYNNQVLGYGNWAILVEDSRGSASGVALSSTSGFGAWASIGVDLAPGLIVSPASAVITITGSTPVVGVGANITVAPTTATVTVTGGTPVVTVSANVVVTPTSARVTTTGGTSALTLTANTSVSPTSALVELSGGTPVVSVSANVSVSPTSVLIVISGGTPSVTIDGNVHVSPLSAIITITGSVPNVFNSGTLTVTGSWATNVFGYVLFLHVPITSGVPVAGGIANGELTVSLPIIDGDYLVISDGIWFAAENPNFDKPAHFYPFTFRCPPNGAVNLNEIVSTGAEIIPW